MNNKITSEKVVFGSGCFWCTEAVFSRVRGVLSVRPGYAGGVTEDPNYNQVCSGKTGHAEVLEVVYDPKAVSFSDLLQVFFATHDPTTLNRQGGDIGSQYRSAIFYTNTKQGREAKKLIDEYNNNHRKKIVTELEPLKKFYPGENYHFNYFARNKEAPYCQAVISPKLEKLKDRFSLILKNDQKNS